MNHRFKTIWETKDGKRIKIKDMEDSHLVNTIKFLRRVAEHEIKSNQKAFLGFGYPQGEMAQDAYDQEERYWNEITEDELIGEHFPCFDNMIEEGKKRKLLDCAGEVLE